MQNTLAVVMTIKSPEDYRALVALLPQAKDEIDKSFSIVKTVHFARILLLDSNKVAIITEFDGDFDTYVQDFASALGPVFDAVFQHIEDAPPLPVEDPQNTPAFVEYTRKHHLPPIYFYSAYPDLTVYNILHPQT